MLDKLFRAFGLDLRRLDTNGKIDEYRLILRKSDKIDLTVVPAVIDGRKVRFAVNFRHDLIQQHHFRGEFYERDELELISKYFTGGVFIDIGANVGNHALYAAMFLGAQKVIAFEPGELAATILKCNVALNDLSTVIEIREVALSDESGAARFENPNPHNLGMARIDVNTIGATQLIRGDEVIEHADFIKIDTEGLEFRVLKGLVKTLTRDRPPVFVEVSDENEQNIAEFFRDLKYVIREKKPSYPGMANWLVTPEI